LKVVQRGDHLFHVFKPDDADSIKEARESPIPQFFRVRTVEISVCRKYAWCSCGYGSRYKAPCRHIICVFGERFPRMYGVRWYIHYQLFFERDRWEKITAIFRQRELEEWGRDPNLKQQIYVKGLKIPDVISSNENIELADRLIFWNEKKGKPRLRGRAVPPITNDGEESDGDSFPSDGGGIFHSQTQNAEATLKIWDQDKTLAAQQKLQEKLSKTTEYATAGIVQVQRELLNLSIGDPEILKFLKQQQDELLSKVRQLLAGKQLEKSGGVRQQMAFPVTGRESSKRTKHEGRKRSTDPGVCYPSLSQK
jgi:hypothetical protein